MSEALAFSSKVANNFKTATTRSCVCRAFEMHPSTKKKDSNTLFRKFIWVRNTTKQEILLFFLGVTAQWINKKAFLGCCWQSVQSSALLPGEGTCCWCRTTTAAQKIKRRARPGPVFSQGSTFVRSFFLVWGAARSNVDQEWRKTDLLFCFVDSTRGRQDNVSFVFGVATIHCATAFLLLNFYFVVANSNADGFFFFRTKKANLTGFFVSV